MQSLNSLISSVGIAFYMHQRISSVDIETRTSTAKNLGPNHLSYRKIPPIAVTLITQCSGMRVEVVERLTAPMAGALPYSASQDMDLRSQNKTPQNIITVCPGGLNRAGLLL